MILQTSHVGQVASFAFGEGAATYAGYASSSGTPAIENPWVEL